MMTRLEKKLNTIGACRKAIDWASTQKGSFQKSWDKCPRGDWLLWLLTRSKVDRKKIVLASCKIARTVLKYVPDGEERPLKAIQTTEAWVEGKATLEEVKESSNAADAASYAYFAAFANAAAAASAAAAAAAANAYAAYYADAVASVASAASASYAASAAAADASADDASAADDDARKKSLLNSAKIVRKLFPNAPKF